jgi:hypothetical protein
MYVDVCMCVCACMYACKNKAGRVEQEVRKLAEPNVSVCAVWLCTTRKLAELNVSVFAVRLSAEPNVWLRTTGRTRQAAAANKRHTAPQCAM